MDHIAVISDLHGNVPALEAVLDDIHARGISRILCLGDLVGKGPNSDRTLDLARENCEKVIRGNWDDFLPKESDQEVIRWHQQVLGKERLLYLESLPNVIEFYMSGRFIRLFHASPRSLYERVQPWDEEEIKKSLFGPCVWESTLDLPQIVGYGDIHQAYLDQVEGGRMLFNTGSVGNPLDLPQASYVILHGEEDRRTDGLFGMEFVRIPYDIEQAVQQAVDSGMPQLEDYAAELRTAVYRGLRNGQVTKRGKSK
ncbi:metallophosphoesterase family protein [Gorillibacterium sp. CAU 1737]|uniref:metallophosphoesterase family protein n=1 Tax=Gorillibacterium sp. CAU 1737 TaxID=3140362 RepID=UPI003261BD8A